MKNKVLLYAIAAVAAVLVLTGGVYGYLYSSSPEHLRQPALEHYHFRTQIIVDGEPVDFSTDRFQQEYDSDSCSVELTERPIHFHDNVDQMTHIHWDGMTGGELLKYYGWNLTGGADGSLGRRFDQGFMRMHSVPIYGDLLPDVPDGAKFYVYVGDENGYERKDWNEFLDSNLEDFFGKKSNLKQNQGASSFNIFEWLTPKAAAHGGVLDSHTEDGEEKTEAELTRINNLIGNVVIFVQKQKPTEEQIQERFDNLVPLQDSTCGG